MFMSTEHQIIQKTEITSIIHTLKFNKLYTLIVCREKCTRKSCDKNRDRKMPVRVARDLYGYYMDKESKGYI